MKHLTQKELKRQLKYNPETGIFNWIVSKPGINKNKIAGTLHSLGYIVISFDNKSYKAHRLAFLYMNGYFPENEIDHEDRIRNNNKWKNLRESTRICQTRNTGNFSHNKSGVKGVYLQKEIKNG